MVGAFRYHGVLPENLEGAIGCISAIWWRPDSPIWSLTYVGIGALVMFALAVYGGEAEAGS
jgi:hypothetical protein